MPTAAMTYRAFWTPYRKDNYDNNTAKYDFSGESQAVARMYESDSAVVAEYNASLTAAHDYANGAGRRLGFHRCSQ